jgi:hypothetical protein
MKPSPHNISPKLIARLAIAVERRRNELNEVLAA